MEGDATIAGLVMRAMSAINVANELRHGPDDSLCYVLPRHPYLVGKGLSSAAIQDL